LAPDQVHGDRAALRTSTPNGARERAESRDSGGSRRQGADGRPDRAGRSGTRTRSGDGTARQGPRSRRTDQPAPPGPAPEDRVPEAAAASTADQPVRKSRRGGRSGGRPRPDQRPDNASEMSTSADNADAESPPEVTVGSPDGQAAAPRKRRSRGRRGGRKRNTRPAAAGEPVDDSQDAQAEGVTADGEGDGDNAPEAGGGDSADTPDGARKRRRRGRRGGRRHRGSRGPKDGTLGAPDGSQAADGTGTEPAPAAAGESGPPDE
jgi:hypothetical protein